MSILIILLLCINAIIITITAWKVFRGRRCKKLIDYQNKQIKFNIGGGGLFPLNIMGSVDQKRLEESCEMAKALDDYVYRLCGLYGHLDKNSHEFKEFQKKEERAIELLTSYRIALVAIKEEPNDSTRKTFYERVDNMLNFINKDKSKVIQDITILKPNSEKLLKILLVGISLVFLLGVSLTFLTYSDSNTIQENNVKKIVEILENKILQIHEAETIIIDHQIMERSLNHKLTDNWKKRVNLDESEEIDRIHIMQTAISMNDDATYSWIVNPNCIMYIVVRENTGDLTRVDYGDRTWCMEYSDPNTRKYTEYMSPLYISDANKIPVITVVKEISNDVNGIIGLFGIALESKSIGFDLLHSIDQNSFGIIVTDHNDHVAIASYKNKNGELYNIIENEKCTLNVDNPNQLLINCPKTNDDSINNVPILYSNLISKQMSEVSTKLNQSYSIHDWHLYIFSMP